MDVKVKDSVPLEEWSSISCRSYWTSASPLGPRDQQNGSTEPWGSMKRGFQENMLLYIYSALHGIRTPQAPAHRGPDTQHTVSLTHIHALPQPQPSGQAGHITPRKAFQKAFVAVKVKVGVGFKADTVTTHFHVQHGFLSARDYRQSVGSFCVATFARAE